MRVCARACVCVYVWCAVLWVREHDMCLFVICACLGCVALLCVL